MARNFNELRAKMTPERRARNEADAKRELESEDRDESAEPVTVAVYTDGFAGARKRSLALARKLDRGENIKPQASITFADPMDMLEVLTIQRVRVYQMARTEPASVSALASKLHRLPASVRRDVKKLESMGILRTREQVNAGHGRVKIVEPVAHQLELRALL